MSVITETIRKMSGQRSGRIALQWELKANSDICSGPVCLLDNEQTIVIGTKAGELYAIDRDGKSLWSFKAEQGLSETECLFLDDDSGAAISSQPVAGTLGPKGGRFIVFGTSTGKLFALDSFGKTIWSFQAKGPIRSCPLVADINNDGFPEIVIGSSDQFVYALSAAGKLLWKFKAESAVDSGFALLEEKKGVQLIFGTDSGKLVSLSQKGEKLWEFATKGRITAVPQVVSLQADQEKQVLFGSHDGALYAVDSKGYMIWNYMTEGRLTSSVQVRDVNKDGKPEIIFGSCDSSLYVLNNEGSRLWSYETDFWIITPPLITDIDMDSQDEVIVGSMDNFIYVLAGEGNYALDYIPGVSAIAGQRGHFAEHMTSMAGSYCGTRLWKFHAGGMVLGMALLGSGKGKEIIVTTNKANILKLAYQKE